TNFDTVLYVRSGSCTGAEMACNDDACAIAGGTSHGSRVTPTVTAGQPVAIVVDGFRGLAGSYSLSVTPPAGGGGGGGGGGGSCGAPTVIPPQGGGVSGTTSGASALPGSCGSSGTSPQPAFSSAPPPPG